MSLHTIDVSCAAQPLVNLVLSQLHSQAGQRSCEWLLSANETFTSVLRRQQPVVTASSACLQGCSIVFIGGLGGLGLRARHLLRDSQAGSLILASRKRQDCHESNDTKIVLEGVDILKIV